MEKKNLPMLDTICIMEEGKMCPLAKLDLRKASGPDKISTRVLKELSLEIAPALANIYQSSINTRNVPAD